MTTPELITAACEGIAKFSAAPNHVVEGLIAALEAQMWRDIATAPRDGTEILICAVLPWHGLRCDVAWADGHWKTTGGGTPYDPTHWKPLDAPEAKP